MNIRTYALFLLTTIAVGTETAPRPVASDYLPPAITNVTALSKKIRLIYLIPSGRTPTANYQAKCEVLCAFVTDLFRRDLQAKGMRCDGPAFVFDPATSRLKVHLLNGTRTSADYSASPWDTVGTDVQSLLPGDPLTTFDLILVENYDPTGAAPFEWNNNFTLGAGFSSDVGRAMISSWMLQDQICATTIPAQIAKFKDATPIAGRRALGDPDNAAPSPVYEFAEDGFGVVAFNLGLMCWSPLDVRPPDVCIMGNGFRNMRANYIAGVDTPLAQFSDEVANVISASRCITTAADLTDTVDPGALVQVPLRMATGASSIPVTVHAWDDKALNSVVVDANFSLICGWALSGTTATRSGSFPLPAAVGNTPITLRGRVTDRGGRTVLVQQMIEIGKGADFTLSSLGGNAPFNATVDASPTVALGGTVSSYAWNFGDGGTASGLTASHIWNAAGTYTVTLTVTYADSSTSTGTRQVRVLVANTHAPVVTVGTNQRLTLPASTQVTGTATDADAGSTLTTTWTKVSGPGIVTFGNPSQLTTTAKFDRDGVYVIRLTASDGSLSSSANMTVFMNLPGTTIIDNATSGYTDAGGWITSTVLGYGGTSSRFSSGTAATASWSATLPAGWYEAAFWAVTGVSTSTAQPIAVTHADGVTSGFTVNGASGAQRWVNLGLFRSNGTNALQVRQTFASPGIRADAVRFIAVNGPVLDNGLAGYTEAGTWTAGSLLGQARSSTRSSTVATATAAWSAALTGDAHVLLFRLPSSGNSPSWSATVSRSGGTSQYSIDARSGGAGWVDFGRFTFAGTAGVTLRHADTLFLRADALRFATDIVLDNNQPGYREEGPWGTSSLTGLNGSSTRFNTSPEAAAVWRVALPSGPYRVWWYKVASTNAATNIQIDVTHDGGTATSTQDGTAGTSGWVKLGTHTFSTGAGQVRISRSGTTNLRADAVRFEPVGTTSLVTAGGSG